MNKKKMFFAFALIASLSSCADTSELYKGDAYISQNFLANRYNVWGDGLKEASIVSKKSLNNVNEDGSTKGCYFAGSEIKGNTCYGYGQLKSRYPEAIANGDKTLYWTVPSGGVRLSDGTYVPGGLDIVNNGVGKWADQSGLEEILYGQNKKLIRLNKAFSRGYLSKLYNGQIQCDAWSSYSLVELDKSGYGALFPCELHEASYFAFAARGGSDTPAGCGRLSRFDVEVTFYKLEKTGYAGYSFSLNNVPLETNISAEDTSLVGFYFDEVGFDPSGVVGMSMTYSLKEDEITYEGEVINPSDDFDDDAKYHTGLMLLEILFPDSTWY